MSREILFKAKQKNWRELPKEQWWVEGLPQKMWGEWHMIPPDDENTAYPIDPETLCQYAGKTDRKGKQIWENDIVSINQTEIGFVEYRGEICGFTVVDGKKVRCCTFLDILEKDGEVQAVGNRFDNPELLGGTE